MMCASFHSPPWIQTRVIVQKQSIGVEIVDFLYRAALKFYRCPLKSIGYLIYATSFCNHLWIQTGVRSQKSPIWVKTGDLLFVWPWHLMYDYENNRAPSLCHFKLFAFFRSLVICKVKLEMQFEELNSGQSWWFIWYCVALKFEGWP